MGSKNSNVSASSAKGAVWSSLNRWTLRWLTLRPVAHMREMTIAAGVYDIPVHSENTSTGSLDDLDPTSPLDLRRLEINAQLDSVHEDPLQDKPIPFPSNEEINAVHGQGTVAFELEAELKTRDSQHMNKSRPDIIVSDLDGGIALSGICMAVAGTGTHVFGAAPQAGFWEHAWKSHTPGATPTPTEDDQAYRYWVDHTYPMSTIPWSTFTTPGHLSGIFEVNHEQVNAARILARDNYHLQLQSDEAVPLAVALYNEEFQTFASKGSKKGRKRVVGIILRSRKEYH